MLPLEPPLADTPTNGPAGPGRLATTPGLWAAAAVAAARLWWAWPSLRQIEAKWLGDPRYSHGFLVPLISVGLLWYRRKDLAEARPAPSPWGLLLVAAGSLLGLADARFYLNWVEGLAPLVSLAGLALLAGGWAALKWAGPSILHLLFMVPLPYQVETALGFPLGDRRPLDQRPRRAGRPRHAGRRAGLGAGIRPGRRLRRLQGNHLERVGLSARRRSR